MINASCQKHTRVRTAQSLTAPYILIGLFFLLLKFGSGNAQNFRNEWIDYSKTYYRFGISSTIAPGFTPNNHHDPGDYNGLRRIPFSTLQAAGLSNASAEHFQLWRNGKEIPLFVSPVTGPLGSDSYIEFWGEANDGIPDTEWTSEQRR